MDSREVVYLISDNIISSLGFSTRENVGNIELGKSGISLVQDALLWRDPFYASRIDRSLVSAVMGDEDFSGFSYLETLMILSVKEALSHCSIDPSSSDTIFVFSTTKGNVENLQGKSLEFEDSAYLFNMAKKVSSYFNAVYKPVVVSNACISGLLAISVAQRLIKSGKYQNAVVVGGDMLTEFVVSGFMSFKSVSDVPCRPYDKNRNGLTLGEGVATVVLSSEKPENDGDEPYVIVSGSSSSNDANHISGPSRTGDGLSFAVTDALEESGLSADDIDFVNMHGTATLYNDEMEAKALALSGLSEKPLVSLKGYFGHTMGASGLIEFIVCAESIRRGKVYKTAGYTELGVPVPVNVTQDTVAVPVKNVLKTASGFGGCNAAVVLSSSATGAVFRRYAEITVSRSCVIEKEQVSIDGIKVYADTGADFATFIRGAFKNISESYMKFSKMDDLCKLGVTVAEYLLKDLKEDCASFGHRDVAVVLSNKASSLDTDVKHQSILDDKQNGVLSPAVFVYTLPNIVAGEICIRHKFQGENTFFIFDKENQNMLVEWVSILFSLSKAKMCIVGWVEFLNGEYKACLSLLEQRQDSVSVEDKE